MKRVNMHINEWMSIALKIITTTQSGGKITADQLSMEHPIFKEFPKNMYWDKSYINGDYWLLKNHELVNGIITVDIPEGKMPKDDEMPEVREKMVITNEELEQIKALCQTNVEITGSDLKAISPALDDLEDDRVYEFDGKHYSFMEIQKGLWRLKEGIMDNKPEKNFDPVSKPSHYTEGRKYEPRKVIHDWGLNFNLGNAVKYISRAGRKVDAVEDLRKAIQYIEFEIEELENSQD